MKAKKPRSSGRIARPLRELAASAVIALALGASASAEEILVDGVAAQVGDQIVLASEIEEIARPIIERMRAAGVPESEFLQMRKDALERLIESKLIEGVVQQLELGATKSEIDNAIASGLPAQDQIRGRAQQGAELDGALESTDPGRRGRRPLREELRRSTQRRRRGPPATHHGDVRPQESDGPRQRVPNRRGHARADLERTVELPAGGPGDLRRQPRERG
ncbi:MAG: SurA N-terminal domain-containing protein [Deltaproteobacteria bacterium]|nr:SurA N-terminal domain-containing protein [Deltaproteobacteria bacterium]